MVEHVLLKLMAISVHVNLGFLDLSVKQVKCKIYIISNVKYNCSQYTNGNYVWILLFQHRWFGINVFIRNVDFMCHFALYHFAIHPSLWNKILGVHSLIYSTRFEWMWEWSLYKQWNMCGWGCLLLLPLWTIHGRHMPDR